MSQMLRGLLSAQVSYVRNVVGITSPTFQMRVPTETGGDGQREVNVLVGDAHTNYKHGYSPSEVGLANTDELQREIRGYLHGELELKERGEAETRGD